MEDASSSLTGDENRSNDSRILSSFYSKYFTSRVRALLSSLDSSNFLGKISGLFSRAAHARSRRRRTRLPLPFPHSAIDSSLLNTDVSSIVNLLEDVAGQIYSNLHYVQKNLQFWESKAEGSNAQKAYFMLFERGPQALLDETVHLVRGRDSEVSYMQHLCHSASTQISEKIAILSSLRCCLATFFAQVYVEVWRSEQEVVNDPDAAWPSLLFAIITSFSKFEEAIGDLHRMRQIDSPADPNNVIPLLFKKLPHESKWLESDSDITDTINMVYENLNKLESYISFMVVKNQKPRKVSRYWIRYTCGAVGLSVCSIWLLKHSSLMGSPDIGNWIREAKTSTVSFFDEHVEQPLLSIRDELFETFRKRHKGMMDLEEVHLTSNSLHRMLLAFTEQVKGKNSAQNASDLEMLEIVMSRYETELMHPISNLLNGELARALLIQVQKLKLDIETAMLELNQILRANEINFAILAALPAFFLSFGLLMLLRAWYKQDTRAQGIGRISRIQRRLLVVEVEKRIMMYQTFLEARMVNDAECMSGLLLYSLNRLYHAVESHAKATGEWRWLKEDILELANPDLQTAYKLTVTSRVGRMYECLLPSLKQ